MYGWNLCGFRFDRTFIEKKTIRVRTGPGLERDIQQSIIRLLSEFPIQERIVKKPGCEHPDRDPRRSPPSIRSATLIRHRSVPDDLLCPGPAPWRQGARRFRAGSSWVFLQPVRVLFEKCLFLSFELIG